MSRLGRPRKIDANRNASGRIRYEDNRDYGTPESQSRRLWLCNGKETNLTSYPLGIMLANEVITQDMHQAGCKLAWLHTMVYGRTSITAQKYDIGQPGRPTQEPDEKFLIRCKQDWRDASGALKSLSRQHYDAVVSVAVYDRVPGFLKPKIPTGKDVKEGKLITEGLREISRVMGYGRRAA